MNLCGSLSRCRTSIGVEHSIHARLYSLLRDLPLFDRHFPLARGAAST